MPNLINDITHKTFSRLSEPETLKRSLGGRGRDFTCLLLLYSYDDVRANLVKFPTDMNVTSYQEF